LPVAHSQPSPRIAAAVDLGRVAPDTVFDFVVAVELRDRPQLHRFLDRQRFTRDTLGPWDFADRFAVSAVEYQRLVTWLEAHQLTVMRTVDSRATISARGTAAAIEAAFGVELHDYVDASGRFVASISGLTVAPEVAPTVGGVLGGFDGSYPWFSHAVRLNPGAMPLAPSPGAGAMGSFTASQLESMYSASAITNPGQGQTVVILGAGDPPKPDDISGYFNLDHPYEHATNPGSYTVELVGGPNRDPKDVADQERGENTLDVDMVAAFAPSATVVHVITATNAAGLFADGISYILDKHPKAIAVTVSYGRCERGAASEMPILNALFMQAKAQGQTWFFAAGDSGSDGCDNGPGNNTASVGWPASSPYAIGVGGTQIDPAGSGTGEVAWDSWGGEFSGAGGGGASESLDKPAYQNGVTPNDGARDEPDVSALGGPPGVEVFLNGKAIPIGGTSAAAPMWAGMWALLAQGKNLTSITNAHEELYSLGKAGKGFNDITGGNNGGPNDNITGGYPAAPGYDLATGWGSPNVAALIQSWQ
jgi:kumamolisin